MVEGSRPPPDASPRGYADGRVPGCARGRSQCCFLLPAKEADIALRSFAVSNVAPRKASMAACQAGLIEPKSVLVSAPDWKGVEVPAAYQSLVYEHVIERLRRTKDVGDVYVTAR